MLKGVKRA